jgi:hypothetical protein
MLDEKQEKPCIINKLIDEGKKDNCRSVPAVSELPPFIS